MVLRCCLIEKIQILSVVPTNFYRGYPPLTTAKPNAGGFFVLVKLIALSNFSRVNEMMRFKPALGLAASVTANGSVDRTKKKFCIFEKILTHGSNNYKS